MLNPFILLAQNATDKIKQEKAKLKKNIALIKKKIKDKKNDFLNKYHETLQFYDSSDKKDHSFKTLKPKPYEEKHTRDEETKDLNEDHKTMHKNENDLLLCPISQELMTDPVMTPYGHCFQREHIEAWLLTNNTCPLTNNSLSKSQLVPCFIVKSLVEEHIKSLKKANLE